MRRSSLRAILAVLLSLEAAGCASVTQATRPDPAPTPGDVLYVADGAGDFRCASAALRQAAAQEHVALNVETFIWSHGHWRILADELDEEYAKAQGLRLAEEVLAHRQAYPDDAIYLLGHSAGCAVVLAAGSALPDNSVDRIILLAPAVPNNYDLRPALHAARGGIDVHYSREDHWMLGTWVRLMWAFKGRWIDAAGLSGFHLRALTKDDARWYKRLKQFVWQPDLAESTDNHGDHYGAYQPGYVRSFILPRLTH